MAAGNHVDVLVVGSGASGLAAAARRRARRRPRRARRRRARSSPATRRRRRAASRRPFGEDDSPEHPRRGRLGSSHETADPRLVEVLTAEAPGDDPWLEQHGVEFTRENGGYRLARCGGATRKRLLQVGDRTGHAITTALRDAVEASSAETFPKSPLARARADRRRAGAPACGEHELEARRGRARGRRPLLPRGRGARRAVDEPPRRDRRGDADRARARRRGARPRRAPVPPERRRLAGDDAGLLDPRDDARLRRRAPERRAASSSPTRSARATSSPQAIVDEVDEGRGVETPDGRPAVWLDTTRIAEADAEISLPYMLRRYRAAGIDPLAEPILTYPVLHYQNGGLVIDEHGETTRRGPLRLRRDRRRHARAQPDDGQLAARVLRLRPPRRARAAAEKASG